MSRKERIDKLLVDSGLVQSRERAKALIMEGKVLVSGIPVTKPGTMIDATAPVILKADDIPFVGRGGVKLESALDHFSVDLSDKIIMDVGCSTGGFTDCVLKKNAGKVYAIDVGYGQFDWRLRKDPRVVLLEKTNIRYLERERITDGIDCAVIDVSFISLLKVLPKVREFLVPHGEVLALIKPQFEVGRFQVGRGGVVKDETLRLAVVEQVKDGAAEMGYTVKGIVPSAITGQKGNVEYFIYLGRG